MAKKLTTRRIALNALFIAMALIMFIIESQFPPIIAVAPGAKMGLSNIFSLMALAVLGVVDAFIVAVIRCLLGAMFGNVSALMYSLSGGVVSLAVMSVLYVLVCPKISIVAISVVGAVVHNIVQVLVLCAQVLNFAMLSYLPWLCVAGVAAGLIVGFACYFLIKYLPRSLYKEL